MKCHEIRAMLPAYLDRTLSPTERSTVQLHLKECHECQKVLQSYSSVQKKDSCFEPVKMIKKTGLPPKKAKRNVRMSKRSYKKQG
jgi:predicted anti-sigma-YlaC factor YlaD